MIRKYLLGAAVFFGSISAAIPVQAEGWEWIDKDNDGVAYCYYLDSNGDAYIDRTTPDGYVVNAEGAWVENSTPVSKPLSKVGIGSDIVTDARQYVGKLPYIYGGSSLESGADCSGFILAIFAKYGKALPRTSAAQFGAGTAISKEEAVPGDVVFWANASGRIYHNGILSGDGKFIHAASSSRVWVHEDELHNMPTPAGYRRY